MAIKMSENIPFSLSRSEVRDLDRRAIHEYGVPGVVLMENAGRGAAELMTRLNPQRQRVTIFCGPGNNGGDGFVIARHLQNLGYPIDLWVAGPPKPGTDADVNYRIWQRTGAISQLSSAEDIQLLGAGWIVDALFGTGLDRPLAAPFDRLVERINASGNPILAVDIPSGLDCDTGQPMGLTVRASQTATFVALKRGFLESAAKPWIGEVHVIDIGAPKKVLDEFRARIA
jgi:NAD(P)H-hydrate epimerase